MCRSPHIGEGSQNGLLRTGSSSVNQRPLLRYRTQGDEEIVWKESPMRTIARCPRDASSSLCGVFHNGTLCTHLRCWANRQGR